MPPNLEGQFSDEEICRGDDFPLIIAPPAAADFEPEVEVDLLYQDENEIILLPEDLHPIPLEQNLRELLVGLNNFTYLYRIDLKCKVVNHITNSLYNLYLNSIRYNECLKMDLIKITVFSVFGIKYI